MHILDRIKVPTFGILSTRQFAMLEKFRFQPLIKGSVLTIGNGLRLHCKLAA